MGPALYVRARIGATMARRDQLTSASPAGAARMHFDVPTLFSLMLIQSLALALLLPLLLGWCDSVAARRAQLSAAAQAAGWALLLLPPEGLRLTSTIALGLLRRGRRRMNGMVGDHIIVKSRHLAEPDRDGEILEVRGPDGGPPYVVRWSGDGHEGLFFPGPDAVCQHVTPS